MGRIDQAFRRAASGRSSIAHEPLRVVPGESAESVLETYPAETPVSPKAFPATQPSERVTPPSDKVTLSSGKFSFATQATAATLRDVLSDSSLDGKLVGTASMDPRSARQYEALATALRTIQVARGLRTVMISSAVAREGKTLTAVNLSLTLSERFGKRVLLIDADFESPSVHDVFRVPNVSGLWDALSSDRAHVPVVAVSKNLTVLTAGRVHPDSMSALLSPRTKALLLDAASSFDWILLDTPAVTQMADPQLLAWLGDGVMLVVQADQTPTTVVQAAIQELGADRVIGAVLNRVPSGSSSSV